MAGGKQGGGSGPPGGPPSGGPDGRVQALLAEAALDHRDGHGRTTVVVRGGDEPGGPAEQPGLDVGGDEEGDGPGRGGGDHGGPGNALSPLGRGCGRPEDASPRVGYPPGKGPGGGRGGPCAGRGESWTGRGGPGAGLSYEFRGRPAREADGQLGQIGLGPWGRAGRVVDGVGGAHADVLWGGPPGAGWPCGSGMTPGGEQGLEDRPGWRLASAGVGSRAPGPGTRAGPLQPRGEAGVAAQGGVRMRHGNAGGCPA